MIIVGVMAFVGVILAVMALVAPETGPGTPEWVAEQYVLHLRAGRTEEALAMRARESRDPKIADHTELLTTRARATTKQEIGNEIHIAEKRACVASSIGGKSGDAYDFRVFLIREEDSWRIHTVQTVKGYSSTVRPPWPKTWHSTMKSRPAYCAYGY